MNSQLPGNLPPKSESTIILPLRNAVVNGEAKMQVPSAVDFNAQACLFPQVFQAC